MSDDKRKYRIALCTFNGDVIELNNEVADRKTCVHWLSQCELIAPGLWHVPTQNGRTDVYAKLVKVPNLEEQP